MLIIRTEQLRVLQAILDERIVEAGCLFLMETAPEFASAMDGDELRRRVGLSLRRARGYGLSREGEQIGYLALCAALGWDFPNDPAHAWAGQCLANDLLGPPGGRLRNVLEAVSNRLLPDNGEHPDAEG